MPLLHPVQPLVCSTVLVHAQHSCWGLPGLRARAVARPAPGAAPHAGKVLVGNMLYALYVRSNDTSQEPCETFVLH